MPFTAHCFFRARGRSLANAGTPPYNAVNLMLDEIERSLKRAGLKPVAVRCASWKVPGRRDMTDTLAQIAIDAEPGEFYSTLKSWFQWQHVRFDWSRTPPPALEGATPVLVPS